MKPTLEKIAKINHSIEEACGWKRAPEKGDYFYQVMFIRTVLGNQAWEELVK